MYGGNESRQEFAMKAAGKELLGRDWFQTGTNGRISCNNNNNNNIISISLSSSTIECATTSLTIISNTDDLNLSTYRSIDVFD
jgi:hypothetical protein